MSEEYKGIANKALNVVANVEWAKERTEMLEKIHTFEKMTANMADIIVDLGKKTALSDAKNELAVAVAEHSSYPIVSQAIQLEWEMLEQNSTAVADIELTRGNNGEITNIQVFTELVPRENN